jgi:hypothetical protein
MKTISLWQPWATLVALNLKRYETRSWATNYRGPLAIHAAKRPVDIDEWRGRIHSALKESGYGWYGEKLPYGCIVCTVELTNVYRTETMLMTRDMDDYWFGDYSPGRFAWRLENVQLVDNIPARGSQGFWEWLPIQEQATT